MAKLHFDTAETEIFRFVAIEVHDQAGYNAPIEIIPEAEVKQRKFVDWVDLKREAIELVIEKGYHQKDYWPYPLLEVAWEAGSKHWFETSEEIYWDQLECLPPVRHKAGAFMVGEPWSYDPDTNSDIHATFVELTVDGERRYFCRLAPKRHFDHLAYNQEIRHQLGEYA